MSAPILPAPVTYVSAGTRALAGRVVTVLAPGQEPVVALASALTERAFNVTLVTGTVAPADVVVTQGSDAPAPAVGRDPRPAGRAGGSEAYEISHDRAVLTVTQFGDESLFRALVTVASLVDVHDGALPLVTVSDAPRFAWRGLSFDVVRHWFGVDDLKRVIDLLAVHRFNVLHVHLTDSQAWRYEVPGYPALTAQGEHFTGADLSELEAYAAARFLTIVPEVDLPGHTAAVAAALPELAPGPFAHPFAVNLDWDTPGVPEFTRAAIAELAARFASPHVHIGGDEAFGMDHERYIVTVREIVSQVREIGRIPLGWQETARTSSFGVNDLIQLWIAERDRFDADKMKAAVPAEHHPLVDVAAELFLLAEGDAALAAGYGVPLLVSSSDPLYLDRKPAEGSVDATQNERGAALGHFGYEATPSADVLTWEPTEQADIVAAGAEVAGIEAALWCETVESLDDAAQLLLPRLAFVAQRAWGPAGSDIPGAVAAARGQVPAWERLGFGNYHRSVLVFGERLGDE